MPLVATLVSVMFAAGTLAPVESPMWPVTSPRVCPTDGMADRAMSAKEQSKDFLISLVAFPNKVLSVGSMLLDLGIGRKPV